MSRDLVDEVLRSTGRVERRSRALPARVMVYYVLSLTLFFGDAYEEVMRKLVNGLRFLRSWERDWEIPTTSAISQARTRLGEAPLKELFFRVAQPMAQPGSPGAWYRGRRVMAVDGMVLDVADTPDNVAEFGKRHHRSGDSAFPQARILGLAECGTHAIVASAIGSWRVDERKLLRELLEYIPADALILADRGFFSYDLWKETSETGAQLLWRVKSVVRLPVVEQLPDGSYLSELLPKELKADLNRGMKRRVPDGARIPVRVIEYTVTNRGATESVRLITTLTDAHQAPADELAELYAQRWEIEIGFDEIETHQMSGHRVLRSRKPELVKQEIWGLLITHYAIRHLMHEAAEDVDVDPDRVSFIRSLRIIRRSVVNGADFPPSPNP